MNSIPEEQNLEVISLIEKLLPVPERNPRAIADGRAKFLAEARLIQPTISRAPERRHIEWKTIFSRKVQPRMLIFSTLLVIFTLLFGGTGATVYTAQDSLPNQPLYMVKLASEDVRAGLATNNQTRLGLMMDFADLRMQEALQLAAQGKSIPGTVWERMDSHYESALHTAAGLDDGQLRQQLVQIQVRITIDFAKLNQLSNDSRYSDDVAKVQVTLLNKLQLVSLGLTDPSAYRQSMGSDQYPHGWQLSTPTGSLTPQPTPTGFVTPQPTISPSMTSTPGSPTQMPNIQRNNQWNNDHQNDQQHDDHHNDCCQNHDGGGWGH
ncbi:hypothetical protein ANAEL_01868 [Anaerolineales bacterium]|nr:hypothetical protein ANAEL_01868 [Anaerolineales bacterium]